MLFIHGSQHGSWCFRNFVKYFDELGYGTNSVELSINNKRINNKIISIKDYVKEVRRNIDFMKDKPIVVAHSLGSSIIQRYIKEYPDDIKMLILLCPTPPKNIFITMMKVTFNMIRNTKENLFFSNELPKEMHNSIIKTAIKNKVFKNGTIDNLKVVAIDGVELFESTKKCCDNCLTRLDKNGTTHYFHRSVVCSTVGSDPYIILGQEMLERWFR
ncbi:alpha/beta fold hydrolase [Clostridium sp. LCP25S3_F8]|uniref:alpha/beta hydrolase n=1 Tax=Clostridium sp. LCP25S3_F8 TaxID=3438751 RepID=UPI001969BC06